MPTDDPFIIAIVDDLENNIGFAISDMTLSIEGHTEVLQETVEYIFHNALKVLNNAVLNFTREPNYELFAETDTVETDNLKYIAEHLLPAMNTVKANITSNISQATDQVTKYVYEVTSSIIQETNQIVEYFVSLNDVGRLEEISGQNLQSEKKIDTVFFNWEPTILSIAQENIEVVFSNIEEAVEIGINLLHSCLDESVFAVSENIVSLEKSRDTNKAMYILDTIFREQIISRQGLLTEAVSTALIAMVKTVSNFAAAIEEEILAGAELVSGSSIDLQELDLSLWP